MPCDFVENISIEECNGFRILQRLQYDIDAMPSISAEGVESHFIAARKRERSSENTIGDNQDQGQVDWRRRVPRSGEEALTEENEENSMQSFNCQEIDPKMLATMRTIRIKINKKRYPHSEQR